MSDFDTVLERLYVDPSFAEALAANPAAALAGYRLAPEEVELLRSQVTGDTGGQSAVEERATQSSVFGLFGPIAGVAGGVIDALGDSGGTGGGSGVGSGAGAASAGSATPAVREGFGSAGPVHEGFGSAAVPVAREGFGSSAVPAAQQGFGAAAQQGFGPAGEAVQSFGPAGADHGAMSAAGQASVLEPGGGPLAGIGERITTAPPDDYTIRVDADGDGDWDRYDTRGRADGGVDILVDTDDDGRTDFVGQDSDADGRIDAAAYDSDSDGVYERRSYDDDGDGWLDRHEYRSAQASEYGYPHGGTVGQNLRLPDQG